MQFILDKELDELFKHFNNNIDHVTFLLDMINIEFAWQMTPITYEYNEKYIIKSAKRYLKDMRYFDPEPETVTLIFFEWKMTYMQDLEKILLYINCDAKTFKKQIKSALNMRAFI